MIGKKLYYLVISGEIEDRDMEKYLTESEAETVKDIFEELSSPFVLCNIEEIPSKEEFEDEFLSMIASDTLSLYNMINEIKDHYNIDYRTARYLYNRTKNN